MKIKNGESTEESNGDDDTSFVHTGYGCDNCSMFPIKGKRYHCSVCKESYDLCYKCHNKRDVIHPDHTFDVIDKATLSTPLQQPNPVQQQNGKGSQPEEDKSCIMM
eukprot:TRINITY_DN5947_c0_g1_i4.p1 TRINITY_DN5947_c0_g1~~TRINITY_DN5947_c0_g1_i4.p1  ORF type:complete len:106 (-),score=16.95 TRINITY_DN5947_c0_g1_i4:44-361(-)